MRKIVFACFSTLFFLLLSCGDNNRFKNADLSSVNLTHLTIRRFDKDLFNLKNETDFESASGKLSKKYGKFYEAYVSNLICIKGTSDSAYKFELLKFLNDYDMNAIYREVEKSFNDLSDIEDEINACSRYYKFYFPEKNIPNPIAAFTGLNYSVIWFDSILSFSPDMYLGRNCTFYEMAQIPYYKRKNMNRYNIVTDYAKGWLMSEFPGEEKNGNLLETMMYLGKIQFAVEALLPHTSDTIRLGFSEVQLAWCNRNEKNVWGFLLKNKLLYSNEIRDIAQFTNEGPFTNGFAKESPSRLGVWIALQIIRSYMKENPDITLEALMLEKDAQKILNNSKYNP